MTLCASSTTSSVYWQKWEGAWVPLNLFDVEPSHIDCGMTRSNLRYGIEHQLRFRSNLTVRWLHKVQRSIISTRSLPLTLPPCATKALSSHSSSKKGILELHIFQSPMADACLIWTQAINAISARIVGVEIGFIHKTFLEKIGNLSQLVGEYPAYVLQPGAFLARAFSSIKKSSK